MGISIFNQLQQVFHTSKSCSNHQTTQKTSKSKCNSPPSPSPSSRLSPQLLLSRDANLAVSADLPSTHPSAAMSASVVLRTCTVLLLHLIRLPSRTSRLSVTARDRLLIAVFCLFLVMLLFALPCKCYRLQRDLGKKECHSLLCLG